MRHIGSTHNKVRLKPAPPFQNLTLTLNDLQLKFHLDLKEPEIFVEFSAVKSHSNNCISSKLVMKTKLFYNSFSGTDLVHDCNIV